MRPFEENTVKLGPVLITCGTPLRAYAHCSWFRWGIAFGQHVVIGYIPRWQSEYTKGYVSIGLWGRRFVFPPHKWMEHRFRR